MSKILVLGRTMDMGGTEVAMAALLQKLVEKKEDVTLLLVEKKYFPCSPDFSSFQASRSIVPSDCILSPSFVCLFLPSHSASLILIKPSNVVQMICSRSAVLISVFMFSVTSFPQTTTIRHRFKRSMDI